MTKDQEIFGFTFNLKELNKTIERLRKEDSYKADRKADELEIKKEEYWHYLEKQYKWIRELH